jgi:hypothetical protein
MGSPSIGTGQALSRRVPGESPSPDLVPAPRGAEPAPAAGPPPGPAPVPATQRSLRWCKLFPATGDQAARVGEFLAMLVSDRPDHELISAGAAELAQVAIGHAASGGYPFFVTEVDWSGRTVRVAAAPVSATGVIEGPVLGTQFSPDGWAGPEAAGVVPVAVRLQPLAGTVAGAEQASLAAQFPAWHVWFGEATGEWWAIPRQAPARDQIVSAPTAEALASRLHGDQPRWVVRYAPWGVSIALTPRHEVAT